MLSTFSLFVVFYYWSIIYILKGHGLMSQMIKKLLEMWDTRVQSLGHEDPLEKEMANHSSVLEWRSPWT